LLASTRDDVLDNTSLYWFTNTATSAARLYWQQATAGGTFYAAADLSFPAAVTVFPEEYVHAPRSGTEKTVPQPDLLQRSRTRWPLRRLGTTTTIFGFALLVQHGLVLDLAALVAGLHGAQDTAALGEAVELRQHGLLDQVGELVQDER
jgi:hypothetical protein